jgi:hypothetical protein
LYGRLFGASHLLAWCALAALVSLAVLWRLRTRSALLCVTGAYAVLALLLNSANRFRNLTYAAETTVFLWVLLAVATHLIWREREKTSHRMAGGLLLGSGYGAALAELVSLWR